MKLFQANHGFGIAGMLFLLLISPSLNVACAQGTLRFNVTFDGSPSIEPDSATYISQYFEHQMWFRAIGPVPPAPPYHLVRSGGSPVDPWWPRTGTAYLMAAFQDSLAVSAVSGRSFGVASVDLSEFSTFYAEPLSVLFVGYKYDGSTVTTTFVTDGIIDGAGPLADFETFTFDSRFAEIVRLEIPTYGWALDNMVFFSVPEPGVGSLVMLAAALVVLRRSKTG